jgi:SNF2 family DNA or RNA helicase
LSLGDPFGSRERRAASPTLKYAGRLPAGVRVEYRLEEDELVLDLADPLASRREAFAKLADLGAPLDLEPTAATVEARAPREGLAEVQEAVELIGGELAPAEGQPSLAAIEDEQPRYEDVRPRAPEDVVDEARDSEAPRQVVKGAIRELGAFALENPSFEHRAKRDQDYLRRALDQLFPAEDDEPEDVDPVKEEVSRTLREVPDEHTWRARELLLDLAEVRQEAGEPPIASFDRPIEGFQGRLRDYQVTGVGFLLGTGFDAILADEMGLGKTVTTIAALLAADERALVVCPANVLHNWAAEVRRFTGEEVAVWHGRDVEGPEEARIRVTTYTSLAYRDWRDTDADTRPVLVLDEAHKIRNPEIQRARLVDDLPQQHRVLLTGTPIVNGLEDYNQLLQQVDHDAWSSQEFEDTWLSDPQLLRREPKVRAKVADMLQEATQDVVLRRRKEEVLDDLPPRTVSVTPHPIEGEARKRYDELHEEAERVLADDASTPEVFARLHAVRQHVLETRLPVVRDRVQALLAEGESVVVYSHYRDPLDELADALGEDARQLTGDTPPKKREALSRELGDPEGFDVLLAQMQAGGVGLNFTGARHVLFTHLGWTAAVHSQAIDRVHRIGQDEPVQVKFLVSPDTIDERLAQIILRKEQDANLALADDAETLDRGQLADALLGDQD